MKNKRLNCEDPWWIMNVRSWYYPYLIAIEVDHWTMSFSSPFDRFQEITLLQDINALNYDPDMVVRTISSLMNKHSLKPSILVVWGEGTVPSGDPHNSICSSMISKIVVFHFWASSFPAFSSQFRRSNSSAPWCPLDWETLAMVLLQ